MFGWFAQIFPGMAQYALNPALLGGAALIASPIIIHLLNRVRFRKVEFAAMEFLLESQKKNQSRILLEQLLLLLLRILIILAIVALLARIFLNSSQLSMFQGAQSHHVILLDNSGSMKQRGEAGGEDAFSSALKVVRKLVAKGADQPGTQKLSLILLSDPNEPFFYKRDVDEALLNDLADKTETLKRLCLNRQLPILTGIKAAKELLDEDQAAIKYLHVLSDYRSDDWLEREEPSLTLKEITEDKVSVNLVRTVKDPGSNLVITLLEAEKVTSTDIPIELRVMIKNTGDKLVENIPVTVKLDGVRIPGAPITVLKLEPGKERAYRTDVEISSLGFHKISVHLPSDSLLQDNDRHVAISIEEFETILIVDGTTGLEEADYASRVLSPNNRLKVTGFKTRTLSPGKLGSESLDSYSMIYILNASDNITSDGIKALEKYVRDGGGLAWFLGESVSPTFYNNRLYKSGGKGLFPVLLNPLPMEKLTPDSGGANDIATVKNRPYLSFLNKEKGIIKKMIHIFRSHQPDKEWDRDDASRADRVETIGVLKNGVPFMFEHRLGKGTIFTCLTSFGPMGKQDSDFEKDLRWNDWLFGENYKVYIAFTHLLTRHCMKSKEELQDRTVGQGIALKYDPSLFSKEVQIEDPLNNVMTLTASPGGDGSSDDKKSSGEKSSSETVGLLEANFKQTDTPGIYSVRLYSEGQVAREELLAYNVPSEESNLGVAEKSDLKKKIGASSGLAIQDATDTLGWLDGEQAGQSMTRFILFLLFFLLIAEQLMSYRLSYHTRRKEAIA